MSWGPPDAPGLSGDFERNKKLRESVYILKGVGKGPEDIAFDTEGNLYTGLLDGRIVRRNSEDRIQTITNTDGRPLGLKFNDQGHLIVADANRGLLKVLKTGEIQTLAKQAEDRPFGFTNHLDISSDGQIFFTDSSTKYGFADTKKSVLEHSPRGRLMQYNPEKKETTVLLDNLYFANGIVLSEDERFLLVSETTNYRILRYWLKGPKAGEVEVLLSNLPGFPDNLSRDKDGIFWVALPTPRNQLLDRMAPYPFLRKIVSRLPSFLKPKAKRHGFVIKFDEDGSILRNLQDSTGRVAYLASAVTYEDYLYMGSYRENQIWKYKTQKQNTY